MHAAGDARNPTGIKLTQQQRDESTRQGYWSHAIRYGLQYYVAGRFATASRFNPVSANILHHAVELLLKACLAHQDPLDKILEYGHQKRGYGHDINRLWKEFKGRQTAQTPAEFDEIIKELHAFENIRYPEALIKDGAAILIGVFEVEDPVRSDGNDTEQLYVLMLPQIDRLMGFLFTATGANPAAFLSEITDDKQAMIYYEKVRGTLFGESSAGNNSD